jgi:hypothetical protein
MTTERSEAGPQPFIPHKSYIHITKDGNVMLGALKKPIGVMVKSPFVPAELMFCPTDEAMLSREMLLMIANQMPNPVRK